MYVMPYIGFFKPVVIVEFYKMKILDVLDGL